jgi:hypothetical protein
MMTKEWKKLEPWRQRDFVPMQFNRFITYPTSFFHSRFPFEAFGNGPKMGGSSGSASMTKATSK